MRVVSSLVLVLLVFGCSPEDPETESNRGPSGTIRIGNADPVCRECEVELREVARLGNPTDPASISEDASGIPCQVSQLTTDEYAVSGIVGGGVIFVYGPKGTVVRTLGRSGEGPGELGTRVRLVVGPGDTLFVLDDGQARLSVFTAVGEFVRSFPAPTQVRSFARINDGDFLFHPTPTGPDAIPYYITGPAGEERARFGSVGYDPPGLDGRVVAPADPEGFWTASIWTYELRRWTPAAGLAQTVIRDVDWFPPNGRYIEGMPFTIPSPPTLHHVWDDGNGRIWTYTLVPDEAWEPEIPLDPRHEWTRRNFDTVIEVIDLNEGQVIVSDRYDQALGIVCGSPLVYTVVDAEDGDTRLRVMEPTLVGPWE